MKKVSNREIARKLMKNKGLTIIELVIAIAIIGILSVSIVQSMVSSSKTYYKSSTEAQLQSEAQLVANSITDLAIDSYDAKDKFEGSLQSDFGIDDATYETSEKNVLVLYAKTSDGSQYQYAVVRKKAQDELMLFERTDKTGSWATSSAVLANYISAFMVPDIARVENENMLSFELTYKKQDSSTGTMREYKGNYQVLMRNKLYAGKVPVSGNDTDPASLKVLLTPKTVYLDVKGDTSQAGTDNLTGYHVGTIDDNQPKNVSYTNGIANGVEINAEVIPEKYNKAITYKIQNVDDGYFYFVDTTDSDAKKKKVILNPAGVALKWDENKNFAQLNVDGFDVIVTKEGVTDAEGNPITAPAKKTAFKIRRIRSLSLRPVSGASFWKSIYKTDYNGVESAEANYYVESENGAYKDVTIQSSAIAPFIENGGRITWKLYMKENETDPWKEIVDANDKKLYAQITASSPVANGGIATLSFGTAAANGQLYKIETTSQWDPTRKGELVIGVAPTGGGNSSGFYSRGYYIDLLSWVQSNYRYDGITQLLKAELTSAGGTSEYAGYKVVERNGRWYLLYDYNAAHYSGAQRLNFYTSVQTLDIVITNQTNQKGNLGVIGSDQGGKDTKLSYYTLPVNVHRIPNSDGSVEKRIVLKKGASTVLRVQTEYYNVHDRSMFGVYIGDKGDPDAMELNLNKAGLNESNKFLSFSIDEAQYGGLYSFQDTIKTEVTAKASTKAYNPNPMKVRCTADDFYVLSGYGANSNDANGGAIFVQTKTDLGDAGGYASNDAQLRQQFTKDLYMSSYADYTVYIANVEGQNVFVSCPHTSALDANLDWDTKFKNSVNAANQKSNAVAIDGYNADGDLVTGIARAYKSGTKYKLIYKGTEYTYNQTYKYWAK